MKVGLVALGLAWALGHGFAPADASPRDPAEPDPPTEPTSPRDPDPPDPPDPDPTDPTDPDPPDPTDPDPPDPTDPDPPDPNPTDPDPTPNPGQPTPPRPPEEPGEPPPLPETPSPRRISGAPNVDIDVFGRAAMVKLGGDLLIKPRCNEDHGCNGGRFGLVLEMPIGQTSPTGGDRATIDTLHGFRSSWRVGALGDYLRDETRDTGPAIFYLVTAGFDLGVETFRFSPELADPGRRERETRFSFATKLRFLAYVHEPRRYRVAPQLLAGYERNWTGSPAVGVALPTSDPSQPIFTVDRVIAGPEARPVLTATLAVPFTLQRGRYVLQQLGLAPALRWAAGGRRGGYDPFQDHTVRGELWLYWFPTGLEGLDLPTTNVRVGVAPFLDVFVTEGRRTNVGALVEVKVGVRGYEY